MKSTVSKILALYQLCRLDHLVDARRTLGIMPGKYLVFAFNHKSIDLANKEFLDPLNEWMKSSPYFNGGMLHTDLEGLGVKFMADRSIGSTPAYIGTDLIFGVLSEINFVNPEIAANRLDTMTKRFGSRFDRVMDYFGMIIIDSSARGSTSIVDEFMADNPYGNKTISIRASRWEVREHMNYYGQKGWFKVFCGDGTHAPFIVDGHRMVTEDMDPDRVIDVPEECRPDFEMNIVTAIQDLAGISTMGSDQFFPNPEIITKCMTLQMLHEETILVDFYDLHDDLVYHLSKALSTIPKDRLVFIRVDYGAVHDATGLAIGFFDGYETFGRDTGSVRNVNKVVQMPRIKVPVCVAITRPPGQETSLRHIEQLIMDIAKTHQIGMVTMDQYGSKQLLQDLEREGIPNAMTSVIRTDESWVTLKNMMHYEVLEIPKCDRLRVELLDMKRLGDKVVPSHVSGTSNRDMICSHDDVAEALAGMVQSVYDILMDAQYGSIAAKLDKLARSTAAKNSRAANVVQDALGTIF